MNRLKFILILCFTLTTFESVHAASVCSRKYTTMKVTTANGNEINTSKKDKRTMESSCIQSSRNSCNATATFPGRVLSNGTRVTVICNFEVASRTDDEGNHRCRKYTRCSQSPSRPIADVLQSRRSNAY